MRHAREKAWRVTFAVAVSVVASFSAGYLVASLRQHSAPAVTDPNKGGLSPQSEPSSKSKDRAPAVASTLALSSDENRPEALQTLAALRDRLPNSLKIPVLTRRDNIEDGFAALLGLTPGQIGALNSALRAARNKLNARCAEHARVSVADDGTITVALSAFDGGAEVYDELMDSFAATLGKERSEAFKRLLGAELAETFHNFGAEQRTLTIAPTLPGYVDWKDGGIYIKDERQTASGKLETMAHRFWAHRMEYLLPHLQWIEPIVGSRFGTQATAKP